MAEDRNPRIEVGRGPGIPEIIMSLRTEAGSREVHVHQGGGIHFEADSRDGGYLKPQYVDITTNNPAIYDAVSAAFTRATADGNLSEREKRQFNNLRAYITNHSGDGVLDAREQGIIIQRAANIAPETSR